MAKTFKDRAYKLSDEERRAEFPWLGCDRILRDTPVVPVENEHESELERAERLESLYALGSRSRAVLRHRQEQS